MTALDSLTGPSAGDTAGGHRPAGNGAAMRLAYGRAAPRAEAPSVVTHPEGGWAAARHRTGHERAVRTRVAVGKDAGTMAASTGGIVAVPATRRETREPPPGGLAPAGGRPVPS